MPRLLAVVALAALLIVGSTAADAAPRPVPPRTIFLESHDLG